MHNIVIFRNGWIKGGKDLLFRMAVCKKSEIIIYFLNKVWSRMISAQFFNGNA